MKWQEIFQDVVQPVKPLDDDFEKVMSLHAQPRRKIYFRAPVEAYLISWENEETEYLTKNLHKLQREWGLISVTKILIKEGPDDKLKLFQKEKKSSSR